MIIKVTIAAVLFTAVAHAQQQQYTTPVPILKQINKHNEDGSYSYGYEAADGTYKIETKYPDGEVYGKYGYVDDQGQVRTVEYGASRRGFEPVGNEIQVPPPTLNRNKQAEVRPLAPNEEDDGQYREDPSVYYKDDPTIRNNQPRYRQPTAYQPQQPQQPAYQQPAYQQPAYQQPAYRPQTNFNSFSTQPQQQPSYSPQPSYNSQPRYYNPAPPAFPNYNQFQGHPASNVDINTGSYSVQYRRR